MIEGEVIHLIPTKSILYSNRSQKKFSINFFNFFMFSVHCSGKLKNQKDIGTELFADMQDYINQKIENGQILTIQVMPSNVDPVGKDSCTSSLECSLAL